MLNLFAEIFTFDDCENAFSVEGEYYETVTECLQYLSDGDTIYQTEHYTKVTFLQDFGIFQKGQVFDSLEVNLTSGYIEAYLIPEDFDEDGKSTLLVQKFSTKVAPC